MPTFMAALEKETGWDVEKETLAFGAGCREEVMCKVEIRLREAQGGAGGVAACEKGERRL